MMQSSYIGLTGIQAIIGYEWLTGGYAKIASGTFASGMSQTITKFAEKNPHAWYQSFLQQTVAPNAELFGQLVQWGELLAGIALIAGLIAFIALKQKTLKAISLWTCVAGLLVGMFMNAQFYFAAGWTSPSTHGLNMIMFWTQAFLAFVWIESALSKKKTN